MSAQYIFDGVFIGIVRIALVTHYGNNSSERYILDKSYWLVSSFNGNVVPLNGVRAPGR